MPEGVANLCANADVLSWFCNLELSNQISVIGIIVSIFASVISVGLGIISLIQSKHYKKQADEFADTQFMPEVFFAGGDGYITEPKHVENREVSSLGYGFSQTLGKYFAKKTPIYKLT